MPAACLGLGYSVEGVQRFVALVGLQSVMDLFLTARPFDAADALRTGFVARVVAPDVLDETVNEIASSIADNAPLTVRAVKLAARTAPTSATYWTTSGWLQSRRRASRQHAGRLCGTTAMRRWAKV